MDDENAAQKMNTITLIFLLLTLSAFVVFFILAKRKKATPILPLETEVLLLKITPLEKFNSGGQQVKLLVQVFPEKGRNFVREITVVVTEAETEHLKEGVRTKIKYVGNLDKLLKPEKLVVSLDPVKEVPLMHS